MISVKRRQIRRKKTVTEHKGAERARRKLFRRFVWSMSRMGPVTPLRLLRKRAFFCSLLSQLQRKAGSKSEGSIRADKKTRTQRQRLVPTALGNRWRHLEGNFAALALSACFPARASCPCCWTFFGLCALDFVASGAPFALCRPTIGGRC